MNDEDKWLIEIPAAAPKPKERKFRERNPIWTECKAKLIERYLFYFVLVTKTGTYIDGFAGPQKKGKLEMWSAKLVLQSCPRWLKNFFLFDNNEIQIRHLEEMVSSQPPRDKKKSEPKRTVKICHGDFNVKIHELLKEHPVRDKEPAFCLLDQRTFECDWATVQAVANHKKGGNKIEIFYFFPEGWVNRGIHATKIDKDQRLSKWWGNSRWHELTKMRGVIRARHVCERFKAELGYMYAQPFAIYEKSAKGGKIMYYMIHASDHAESMTLMNRAYEKALDVKEMTEQVDLLVHQLGKDFIGAAPK